MKRFIKSTLLSLLLIFSMMLPLIAGAQSEPANTETIPHISITDAIDKAKQSASESNNAKQNNLPVIIDDPFDVESTHAILVETTTDNILIQKNIHEKIAPGELAKLMTAIIASEYAMFDDVVTVSETAVKNSQSYNAVSRLKVGEQLTVRQLLYCLILDNSDVAAYALAEHITGSYADFAVLMNEKAKFIGAQNTNFTNPTGRYDKEQYSTVWDLYVISEYFMQNKDLLEISSTVRYTLPVSEWRTSRTRFYTNNHLLSQYKCKYYYYRYADGFIAGNSEATGNIISAGASRGQGTMHLIFIGAGADPETSAEMYPAFADAVKVFREAYTTYTIKTIVKKNQVMDEAELLHSFSRDYISLVSQSDIKAVVPKDTDISDYRIELSPIEKIMAPVKPGDNLGTFEIYHEQDLVAIGTLTTDETIRSNIILKIGYMIQTFFSFLAVKIILVLLVIAIIAYVILTIRVNKQRIEKMKKKKQAQRNQNGKK